MGSITRTLDLEDLCWYQCEACAKFLRLPEPLADDVKVYTVCGCPAGKWRMEGDNPACRHCGQRLAYRGEHCDCPEAVALRQQDAADAEEAERIRLKATKEMKDKRDAELAAAQAPDLRLRISPKTVRKQRQQAIDDRWLAIKEREVAERERPQATKDTIDGEELADHDGFNAMLQIVESTRPATGWPSILSRTDGRTLMYAQKVNTIAARPNGGKSFISMQAACEAISKGGRVLVLDFDNRRPDTLADRAKDMALLHVFQNADMLAFPDVDMMDSRGMVKAAVEWLLAAPNPIFSFVILDTDTAAGAPSDGKDINKWWDKYVMPFVKANLGMLILSHVPKRTDEQPPGPIGSQGKRGLLSGACLIVDPINMWNREQDGIVQIKVDKDRPGDLPGVEPDIICDVVAEWMGDSADRFLNITMNPVDETRGQGQLADKLYNALAEFSEGVYSQVEVKKLVKGGGRAISDALKSLTDSGRVMVVDVEGKKGKTYKIDQYSE